MIDDAVRKECTQRHDARLRNPVASLLTLADFSTGIYRVSRNSRYLNDSDISNEE